MSAPRPTRETLRATWDALPAASRAAIEAALVRAVDAELRRTDTFYPSSPGDRPDVEVLGAVADGAVADGAGADGAKCVVHFVASHVAFHAAQSGSDWGTHDLGVGTARVEDGAVCAVDVTLERLGTIRESSFSTYAAGPLVRACKERQLLLLTGEPTPQETITVVRCPQCGATDAGAIEHIFENAHMACAVCGHDETVDDEQIKDEWNTKIQHDVGGELPSFVEPLASTKPGFSLRGEGPTRLVVHEGLGYALAVPGTCWDSLKRPGLQTFIAGGLWATYIVRTKAYYTMDSVEVTTRRRLEEAARRRAHRDDPLTIEDVPAPPGADAALLVTYKRPSYYDDDAIELLMLVARRDERPGYWTAVFVCVQLEERHFKPPAFAALKHALVHFQSWSPDVRADAAARDHVWR